MRAIPLLAALLLTLAACGTRGNLTLPPGPPPKPVLDEWVAPTPPAKADGAKDSKPADKSGGTAQP